MQKSKGSGFLKVCGILMIIGGAITVSFSGIFALIGYAFGNELANAGDYQAGALFGTAMLISGFVSLIGGALELAAGIIGVKNNNRPEKSVTCLVWGIIVLAVNIVGMVFTFLGRPDNFLTIFVSCIAGIGLPVLYIIGAGLNRSADKS